MIGPEKHQSEEQSEEKSEEQSDGGEAVCSSRDDLTKKSQFYRRRIRASFSLTLTERKNRCVGSGRQC